MSRSTSTHHISKNNTMICLYSFTEDTNKVVVIWLLVKLLGIVSFTPPKTSKPIKLLIPNSVPFVDFEREGVKTAQTCK